MDLSIITLNYNDRNILLQLESVIEGTKNISYEQIVIDNHSKDRSLDEIKEKFKQVQIITNQENIGFGKANNQGAAVSKGEFILFLNPDMRVLPGSLEKAVLWMRSHVDVGIMGCKLVKEDLSLNLAALPRRFPRLFDQLVILTKLQYVFPGFLNGYLYKNNDFEKEQEVDSVRGSFFFVRRELITKLGWAFDPRYFLWFEDVDTCKEAKRLGYKVVYNPEISCVDLVGQTFKTQSGIDKQKWFTESMLRYFKKWHPWFVWIWIAIFRPLAILMTVIKEKIK